MNKCKKCGKDTKNEKFCCKSCANSFNNHLYPRRSLEGRCGTCDKPIQKSRKYCCNSCRPYRLDWNGITLGELKSRRKYQKHTAIRMHSRPKYLNSTKSKCCIICGYDKHIEICHVKAINEFDDSTLISEVNSLDNLIALCPNHHWEFDNGLLSLDFPEFDYLHL